MIPQFISVYATLATYLGWLVLILFHGFLIYWVSYTFACTVSLVRCQVTCSLKNGNPGDIKWHLLPKHFIIKWREMLNEGPAEIEGTYNPGGGYKWKSVGNWSVY